MLYHVKPEQAPFTKRIARTTHGFATTLIAAFVFHRWWFPQTAFETGERFLDAIVAAGIFFTFDSVRRKYDIEVTDEAISTRNRRYSGDRKVQRGRIRYLREQRGTILREPGLRLSEHGAIRRFFFGYVWIPAELPQYEEIKSKAFSWMKIG